MQTTRHPPRLGYSGYVVSSSLRVFVYVGVKVDLLGSSPYYDIAMACIA